MKIAPYLHFKGNCAEALKFYEKALGAKIAFKMTFAEAPEKNPGVPASFADKILHATMIVEGQTIFACDPPPDWYKQPQGFSLSIGVEDPARADKFFKALSDGAKIKMPLAETFWAKRFGMLEDKFGIPWMVNCEKEGH